MRFSLRSDFTPEEWQRQAISAWLGSAPEQGPRHGIFDVFTGAGKTVLALGAMAEISREDPDTRFAIVAPSIALARQWVTAVSAVTTLDPNSVGMVGGGASDSFDQHDVLVFVLPSAQKLGAGRSRLAREVGTHRVMLVVDECHKAGAPGASRMFDAPTVSRLGLSATPARADAVDEHGRPVPLEEQPHGAALGPTCFQLTLKEGQALGLLPRFQIHHHGIALTERETTTYRGYTNGVTEAYEALARVGGSSNYLAYLRRADADARQVAAARVVQAAVLTRKSFLYRVAERTRVAALLVVDAWKQGTPPTGAILFNERIDDVREDSRAEEPDDREDATEGEEDAQSEQVRTSGATQLFDRLRAFTADGLLPFDVEAVAIEHSGLPKAERERAVAGLRDGSVRVLVTVKALQEGIDIPDVGLGISVAATSSARQRIQTIGRILRVKRDAKGRRVPADQQPTKQLHLLYVRDTVDEEIYRQVDWGDATGADRNRWYQWPLEAEQPVGGMPLQPVEVDEEQAWARIALLPMPQRWDGPQRGALLSYRNGSVFHANGGAVHNPDDLIGLLDAGGAARGRFTVSPRLHVVLKRVPKADHPKEWMTLAMGRVAEAPRWDASEIDEIPTRIEADPSGILGAFRPAKGITDEAAELAGELGREEARAPAGSDSWYVLWQQACLAAVDRDRVRGLAIAARLRKRKKAYVADAADYLARSVDVQPPVESGPGGTMDLLLPFAARAFAHGRDDLLQAALGKFQVKNQASRAAVYRGLEILAGRSNTVLVPGGA